MNGEIRKFIDLDKNFEKFNKEKDQLEEYLSLEKSVTKFIKIIESKNNFQKSD